MRKNFNRCKYLFAGFMFVLTLGMSSAGPVLAATNNAPGNNGTLKIHEQGTPSGTESNDPKVCVFNVEGFGFDAGQTGYLTFDVQGGDGPTGVDAGPYSFGPTNADGYYATSYYNLQPGHYKATLYGKQLPNGTLDDEKAKSKVFKVTCEEQETEVTPTAVVFNDECGTDNDYYTIPTKTGVIYKVGNVVKTAGQYPGTGTVTVNAYAQAGYTLTGTTTWSHTFTNEPCEENTEVTPTGVTFIDLCGTQNDIFVIPSDEGVDYKVGGVIQTAGNHPGTGTVTVNAYAQAGYTLTGTTTWSHTFTNVPCGCDQNCGCDENCNEVREVTPTAPIFEDECGTEDDTFFIPSKTGVVYKMYDKVVATGEYDANDYEFNGDVTINAFPASDQYKLKGTTTWTHHFTNEECPNNGGDNTVVPEAVTFKDLCELKDDMFTIPDVTGVDYYIGEDWLEPGDYEVTEAGEITVTAVAQDGYVLAAGTHEWSHTFTNEACASGGGGGGHVLGETTTTVVFTPTTTPVVAGQGAQVLASTGSSTISSTLIAIFLITATVLIYAYNPTFES